MVEEMAMPVVIDGEATNLFAITRSGGQRRLHVPDARAVERTRPQPDGNRRRAQPQAPGDPGYPGQRPQFEQPRPARRRAGRHVLHHRPRLRRRSPTPPTRSSRRWRRIRPSTPSGSTTTLPSRSCRSISTGSAPPTPASPSTPSHSVVQTLLSGRDVGDFYVGDDPIEIRAQSPDGMIQDPSGLDAIQLRTDERRHGSAVLLCDFRGTRGRAELCRVRTRAAPIPIAAGLGDGVALGQAMEEVTRLAEENRSRPAWASPSPARPRNSPAPPAASIRPSPSRF